MFYERLPLYPGMAPAGGADGCMKVRLFDDGCGAPCRPPEMRECERVTIENPCRPGERAEVALGLDACGNLVICVHRRSCPPRHVPRGCCGWDDRCDRCDRDDRCGPFDRKGCRDICDRRGPRRRGGRQPCR